MSWRSDTSIAYAIFRFTFGVNICFRGVMRIATGLGVFTAGLLDQFKAVPLPTAAIEVFGHVIPIVETVVGLMLMLGFGTRPALIVGGLMMTSLTFGTMLLQNFNLAWLQLTYSLVFFLLLALRQWNTISIDSLIASRAPESRSA